MTTKPTTQKEQVLKHLKNEPLTTWEAITKYRITRLAVYVGLLKDDGYKIQSEDGTHTVNGRKYHHSIYKLVN